MGMDEVNPIPSRKSLLPPLQILSSCTFIFIGKELSLHIRLLWHFYYLKYFGIILFLLTQTFEYTLCLRHCSWCWVHNNEQNRQKSISYILKWEIDNNKRYKKKSKLS